MDEVTLRGEYAGRAVLVTGGAGFIGSHLVERLVQLGAQVRVLDNLSTGRAENLAAVMKQITMIDGDITDAGDCHISVAAIDTIFHLAARISVPESLENPADCYATNVGGTTTLLAAAHHQRVPHLLFSSSAAVYGAHEGLCRESMICDPLSPYGASKWIGEILCQQYAMTGGLRAVSLRYFNVYGARQRADLPSSGFVARAVQAFGSNSPITLYGDGLQERDFVPVEMVVEANLILGVLMRRGVWQHECVNIASGSSTTLRGMVEQLAAHYPNYNHAELIHYAPARRGDVRRSAADCSKYRRLSKLMLSELR